MLIRVILGVVIGGVLGYGVYRFIGCSSGACPITSNPWISMFFGMAIGGLTASSR
jgi:hypothetical protein